MTARLRRELSQEWARREAQAFEVAGDSLGAADIEALRSLGYAAGSSSKARVSNRGFTEGPDPETRVEVVDAVNRAITLYEHGDLAQSSAALRGIVSSDPRNRLAWEYLGRATLAAGDPGAAQEAFRRALELGPNPADVHLDLARASRELGDDAAARVALENALLADPRSIPARQALARLAIDEGKTEIAQKLLEEAIRMRPRSAELHASLAEVYERLERREDALSHWRKAAEIDPRGAAGERARAALVRLGEGRA